MSLPSFRLGPRHIDLAAQLVTDPRAEGPPATLTELEARLLDHLLRADGALVPKPVLLREVWGYADGVESRAVDYTLRRLRKKLEDDPRAAVHLVSTYGSGVGLRGVTGGPTPHAAEPEGPLPPLDTFVGRDAEQARLDRWITDGARCVTVLGAGGIGKTRLVLEWHRARSRPLLAWVSLRPHSDAEGLARTVATALGGPPDAGSTELAGVLVLDAAEGCAPHLEAVLPAWLRAAPGLQVVATSRVALQVPGGLPLRLDALAPAAAERLYEARAAERGALHHLDDPRVPELVTHLEGHPLAIELAAARAGVRPVAELIRALARPLDTLAAAGHPERSLRAVVGWSWDLLDPSQQAVLAACSVFPGRFGREAAEVAAGGSAVDVLVALHQRSLVRAPAGRRRTFVLPMGVRAFAAEHLPGPRALEVEDRLVAWVLRRTGQGRRPPQRAWILDELELLRSLLHRLQARAAPEAVPLATAIAPTLADRGWQAEALRPLAAWGVRPGHPAVTRARILARSGDLEEAERVLAPSLHATDPAVQRAALLVAAALHLRRSDQAAAARALDAAEALLDVHPDPIDRARLHATRSVALRLQGRSAEGLEHGRAAVDAWTRLGDAAGRAEGQFEVAMASRGLGRQDEARVALEAALHHARETGARRRAATLHVNLGVVHAELGARHLAADHYRRGLDLHRQTGNRQGEAYAWLNLAGTAYWDRDRPAAEHALVEGRALGRAIGDPRIEAHADGVDGIGHFIHGEPEAARSLLARARLALARTGAGRTAGWYATYEAIAGCLLDHPPEPDVPHAAPHLVRCAHALAAGDLSAARAHLDAPLPEPTPASEDARYLRRWLAARIEHGHLHLDPTLPA